MASPRVCWMMVVGLVIVGVPHTNWQAPVVGDPSVCLPMEALWNFCSGVAEPTQQPPHSPTTPMGKAILMRWLRGWAHRRTGGARRQTGPDPLSALSVRVCKFLLGGRVCSGWTAKWKFRGWRRGVAAMWEWSRGNCVQMGRNVCLLSRCFRGVCLSRGVWHGHWRAVRGLLRGHLLLSLLLFWDYSSKNVKGEAGDVTSGSELCSLS